MNNKLTFILLATMAGCMQTTMANSNFVQTTIGTGCSNVCINNQCTSTCSSPQTDNHDSTETISKLIDIDDFDSIVVSGVNIKIFQNNEFVVELNALKDSAEMLSVTKSDSTLVISPKTNSVLNSRIDVTVGLPELKSLQRSGTGVVYINDFNQNTLELDLSGTGQLTAKNNHVENLILSASGTITLDLKASEIKNAQVMADGVNKITLNFTGQQSTLSGEISGVSKVSYCGEPFNSVSVRGISQTKKIVCL